MSRVDYETGDAVTRADDLRRARQYVRAAREAFALAASGGHNAAWYASHGADLLVCAGDYRALAHGGES